MSELVWHHRRDPDESVQAARVSWTGQGKPSDPAHRTRRANLIQRTYPGSIEERTLLNTIRQAIQLTRDLGLRYIWTDSLCIVQDSYSSIKLNAEQMGLIYDNAYLTTCAADGDCTEHGLTAYKGGQAYCKGCRRHAVTGLKAI